MCRIGVTEMWGAVVAGCRTRRGWLSEGRGGSRNGEPSDPATRAASTWRWGRPIHRLGLFWLVAFPLFSSCAAAPDINDADAGIHADAGAADVGPPDCSDESNSESPWCDEVCSRHEVDLGWAERVRWFGGSSFGPSLTQCGNSGEEPSIVVLWRAPFSGPWVIESFGSEGTRFGHVVDGRCGDEGRKCYAKASGAEILTLEAGVPIAAESHGRYGDRRGAQIHRINISPWVPNETGGDCLDGADNDGDGQADCHDPDCAASEECTTTRCAHEIIAGTLPVRVEGELDAEHHINRFKGCVAFARERVLAWQAPATGRFVADMGGTNFQGRLSVRRGACIGPEIGHCPAFGEPSGEKWSVSTAFEAAEGEWVYLMVSATSHTLAFGWGEDTHYVLEIRDWEPETGEKCWDEIDNDGDGVMDESDDECWE